MKSEGIKPNEVTYSTLMNIDSVTYEQGLSIIEKMKSEGIKPNEVTYSTLLEKVNTEEDAIDWIIRFCSTDLIPGGYITSGLKKVFPFFNESSRLMEVFAIMLRFNPLMFFNWLSNFEILYINKFITEYPELPNDTDFNKLGFASYYLNHEDTDTAKKFIDTVTNYNYHYFKYSGYYWYQVGDYEKAEENYKQALSLSENDGHRAGMYDNLSSLIKHLRLTNRTEEAIEYCKKSISFQPGNSPMAKQLLTYFTVENCSIEEMPKKIEELKKFNIGKKTFKEALKEISDTEKRNLIQNILNPDKAVKDVADNEDGEEV
jgi:tetratricopeptide (TPR) repeat protein